MYRTTLPLLPAGIFTDATCIVSMWPYRVENVEKVRQVTGRFLATHGEPVAWGWEGMRRLGIEDIQRPDFGEAPVIKKGEVPVFWGCGVTPQIAVESAGDKIDGLVFAHEPGNMLVTGLTDEDACITKP